MKYPKHNKVEIRRKKWRGKWYYAIKDIIKALTDTPNTKGYIKDWRNRKPKLKRDWDKLTKQVLLPAGRYNQHIRSAHAQNLKVIIELLPTTIKKKDFCTWLNRVDQD